MLNNFTIVIIIVISSFVYLFISFWLEKSTDAGGNAWRPHLWLGTGFLLTLFQGYLPASESIIIANMLIYLAFLSFINRSQMLFSIKIKRTVPILLFFFMTAEFIFYTYIHFHTVARIVLISLFIGSTSIWFSLHLYREYNKSGKQNSRPFYLLFGIYGLTHFLRILHTIIFNNSIQSFLTPNSSSFFSLLFLLLFVHFWNLLYYGTRLREAGERITEKMKKQTLLLDKIDLMHSHLQKEEEAGGLESFYPLIFSSIKDIIGTDVAAIYLYNPESSSLEMAANMGFTKESLAILGHFQLYQETTTAQAFKDRKLLTRSVSDYPDSKIKTSLTAAGIVQIISAAVYTGKTPVGALSIGLRNTTLLKTDQKEVIQLLASQSGTALHNLQLYERIAGSEAKYKAVFDLAGDSILVHEKHGLILDANSAAVARFGYSLQELSQMSIHSLYADNNEINNSPYITNSILHIDSAENWETIFRCRNGEEIYVWITSSSIMFNEKPAIMSVIRDITGKKDLEEHLSQQASTDYLTGIMNRRAFEARFRHEIVRSKRYSHPVSVLLIDIDDFKQINDTFGHEAGDEALKFLVLITQTQLRDTDFFARYGGEEFIIALTESNIQNAENVGNRIRKTVECTKFSTGETSLKITISIGVTELKKTDSIIQNVISRADTALYKAKRDGKNQVVVMADP